jgi:probable rRNA maturation factor
MIHLEIDEEFRGRVKTRLLERAARESLKHEGQAAPTDVLSFPAGDIDPDTGEPYLGDVLISFPRAEAQVKSAGHPVEEEIQLLVTHGILHLLGYDHAEPEAKERMWCAQEEILEALRGSRGLGGAG